MESHTRFAWTANISTFLNAWYNQEHDRFDLEKLDFESFEKCPIRLKKCPAWFDELGMEHEHISSRIHTRLVHACA